MSGMKGQVWAGDGDLGVASELKVVGAEVWMRPSRQCGTETKGSRDRALGDSDGQTKEKEGWAVTSKDPETQEETGRDRDMRSIVKRRL